MKKSYGALLFLNFFSVGLLLPILSLLILDKGATLPQIAIVIGISSFTVFMLELPSGIIADIIGRKLIFLLSSIFFLIATVSMLFIDSFALMIPAFILWGAGRALSSGSIDAFIIDEFIESHGTKKLSSVTSTLAILETVGLAVGAIVGGFLPGLSARLFPGFQSYDLTLIVRCIMLAAVVLLTIFFIKEKPRLKSERVHIKEHLAAGFRFVKSNRIVILMTLSIVFTGFFVMTIETYWQPAFVALLPGKSMMWTLGLLSFGCFTFATLGNLASKRVIKSGHDNLHIKFTIAGLLLFTVLIIFSLQKSALGFGGMFFLLYFVFGSVNVIGTTLLNLQIPGRIRSSMLSFVSLAFQAGCMTAPLFSGALVTKVGISSLWLILGIALFFITALIGIALHSAHKKTAALPQPDAAKP